jgi:hypothetical protein
VTWMSLELTTAGMPIDETGTEKVTTPNRTTMIGESSTPSTVTATPGPAAKKQKIEAPRTKEKKDSGPPLEPGNRRKPNTFLPQGWQAEGQCAAYLGFTQTQHLRMFAISPIVLDAFVKGHGDLNHAKQSKVLELLRDCPDAMASEEEPHTKYPWSEKGFAIWRVALIVAQLRRKIQNTYSTSYTPSESDIERSCRDLDNTIEGTINVPRLDFKEPLVFPKLGPFLDLEEDDLEAYNRVYLILRYLKYSTQSPWEHRFGSYKWDRQVVVDDSHVPHWMRPKATPSEATAPDVPTKPVDLNLPEKPVPKLTIDWMFQSRYKGATQFRAFREEEEKCGFEVHPLPVLQQNITVAYETSVEEFRNNIRALYGLELLSGQIDTLSLRRYLQDGDREAFEINSQSWEEQVKEQLWRPDLDVEKSLFQLTVRPAELGEVIMEKSFTAAWR